MLVGATLARVRSLFRVIPAEAYLDYFASDRSHMVRVVRHSGIGTRCGGLTKALAKHLLTSSRTRPILRRATHHRHRPTQLSAANEPEN